MMDDTGGEQAEGSSWEDTEKSMVAEKTWNCELHVRPLDGAAQ